MAGSPLSSIQSTFRKIAAHATFSEARISIRGALTTVSAIASHRALEQREHKSVVRSFVVTGETVIPAAFPLELRGASIVDYSPSGNRLAVVRNDSKPPGKPNAEGSQFIEIWSASELLASIPTAGKHEQIYPKGGLFDGFSWSNDESKILYSAEATAPESIGVFEPSTKESPARGNKFDYLSSWGEGAAKCFRPSLFIVDIVAKSIAPVPVNSPQVKGMSLGQPVFSPSGDEVVFVAWPEFPRIGVTYCWNRPSTIYSVSLKDPTLVQLVSKSTVAARSPIVSSIALLSSLYNCKPS